MVYHIYKFIYIRIFRLNIKFYFKIFYLNIKSKKLFFQQPVWLYMIFAFCSAFARDHDFEITLLVCVVYKYTYILNVFFFLLIYFLFAWELGVDFGTTLGWSTICTSAKKLFPSTTIKFSWKKL